MKNNENKNIKKTDNPTSWGRSAEWYANLLRNDHDSYQRQVILPNVNRLLNLKKDDVLLDLACGSGFFSSEFSKVSKNVIGIDISPELINIARRQNRSTKFYVTSADNLKVLKSESIDKIVCILAIQNIENIKGVFNECYRVLRNNGTFVIVLNHPLFRNIKKSSWIDEDNARVRRLEEYMSESKISIDMHPGEDDSDKTISFNRPIQSYFKLLDNSNFLVKRLEEWISHKISQNGPRKNIEDKARKEFPMFMMIEAIKIK